MKKRGLPILIVCLCVLLGAFITYDALFATTEVTENQFSMGSVVRVSLTAKKKNAKEDAAAVVATVAQLDAQLTNKNTNSAVGKINQHGKVNLSNEVLAYLERCNAISAETKGAFDVTIGAVSALWDFDDAVGVLPNQALLANALATVGYQGVQSQGSSVSLPQGTVLDFGAMGKGLACENAMQTMKVRGAKAGVIAVGGSVGVYGEQAKVGIRDPFGQSQDSFATLQFVDAVASTSGVYEKHFLQDGINYHHILDVQTGYPVVSELVSVTVICRDGLASDALATACFKLGYDASQTALSAYDAMAVFVYQDKSVRIYNEKYPLTLVNQSYER